jgi:hypothetical protein
MLNAGLLERRSSDPKPEFLIKRLGGDLRMQVQRLDAKTLCMVNQCLKHPLPQALSSVWACHSQPTDTTLAQEAPSGNGVFLSVNH